MIINEKNNINESKYKLDKDTKYVMMYDGEVVKQFKNILQMNQYKTMGSRNPHAVFGKFMKVVNGAIVPLD